MVKIVDLAAERHVVRFFSEDESKVYATLIAIPNYRLEPTDTTSITFYESEVGRPRALHEWFYPGHLSGVEFVYPEKRATEIAAVAEEHVIATKGPEFVPFIEEKQPEPAPTVKELLTEPLVEVKPGGEEVEIAAVTPHRLLRRNPPHFQDSDAFSSYRVDRTSRRWRCIRLAAGPTLRWVYEACSIRSEWSDVVDRTNAATCCGPAAALPIVR